jgi:GT2 family glycosyltransferase
MLYQNSSNINCSQLAVLITCYNRRNQTLDALKALYNQSIKFNVYLVDDGSSDGTSKAVQELYPEVNIIQGNGNLFWVGGMRLAFVEALQHDYEYYLWLNDDTILEQDTIERLLMVYKDLCKNNYPNSIIVGSTKDMVSGKPTYGGAIKSTKWYSNKYEFLQPSSNLQECDTMFGNCILIPKEVARKVGNIDKAFIHSLGDLDYGLRARKLGCSIWVAPGYVGTCSKNSIRNSWVDTDLSLLERLKKALSTKAFPPKPWAIFCIRHSGFFWFVFWLLPYIRSVIGYKNLATSPTFTDEDSQQGNSQI